LQSSLFSLATSRTGGGNAMKNKEEEIEIQGILDSANFVIVFA
jgi:hypothetical protein